MKKALVLSAILSCALLSACSDPCTKFSQLSQFDNKTKYDCKSDDPLECLLKLDQEYKEQKKLCDASLAKLDESERLIKCKDINISETQACRDLKHKLALKEKEENIQQVAAAKEQKNDEEDVKKDTTTPTAGNKDQSVGILFIFPNSKTYNEDYFAIRKNLRSFITQIDRDVDQLNAVPYDSGATQLGWSKANSGTLARLLDEEVKTSDVLEPNLFISFTHALGAFEAVTNVSQKYLVFISDAEGALVGNVDQAQRLIGNFSNDLKKGNVTPIIIGYSPDGPEAMPNINLLKQIASNNNGVYFQANDTAEFTNILTNDVYNYIYNNDKAKPSEK